MSRSPGRLIARVSPNTDEERGDDGVDKERIAMETAGAEFAESEPAQTLHGKEWTRGNRCHAACAELEQQIAQR
jgi:hypothetical protein